MLKSGSNWTASTHTPAAEYSVTVKVRPFVRYHICFCNGFVTVEFIALRIQNQGVAPNSRRNSTRAVLKQAPVRLGKPQTREIDYPELWQ